MWEDNELMNEEIEDVLEHHGIKGQKWGVRRYQNDDGSLTSLGKKRLAKGGVEKTPKRKSVKDMNASELRSEIERRALVDKLVESKQAKTAVGRFINKMTSKNKSTEDLKVEIEKQELRNELKNGSKKTDEEPKSKELNRHKLVKKDLKDLSDKELEEAIERAALEQRFRQLHPEDKSFIQKTAEKLRDKMTDAAIEATAQVGKDYLIDKGKKALGLTDEEYEKLKRDADILGFKAKADKAKADADKAAANARQEEEKAKQAKLNTENQLKKQKEKEKSEESNDKKKDDKPVTETKAPEAKSMAKSGDSVSEIADKLGVSTSTVSKMLDGQTARVIERKSGDKGTFDINPKVTTKSSAGIERKTGDKGTFDINPKVTTKSSAGIERKSGDKGTFDTNPTITTKSNVGVERKTGDKGVLKVEELLKKKKKS